MDELCLKGKSALITAAAGAGIGQATARRLAMAGASVMLTDRSPKRTEQVAARIAADTGSRIEPMVLDVTDEDQVNSVVREATRLFGGVDILVNNSGINQRQRLWEMSTETWRKVLDVCLTSHFWTMRAVLPGMIERRSGWIVNMASAIGWVGTDMGEAHYIAAKAGVMGLTRAAAAEVGRFGVRVNAIAPGLVYNEFLRHHYDEGFLQAMVEATPLGREGRPDDVANAVLYLVSGLSGFTTGETLCVSGGWYMHP